MSTSVATGAGYRLMWIPANQAAWFALVRLDGSGSPESFLETDSHTALTAKVIRMLEAAVALGTYDREKWPRVLAALRRYLFGDTAPTADGKMMFRRRNTWTSAAEANEYPRSPPADELERAVLVNQKPRRVLRTTDSMQQVAMTVWWLPEETHPATDQYFLVKQGAGEAVVDGHRTALRPLSAFVVERGSRHEIRSTSEQPLHLLVLYTPKHHDAGRIDEVNVDFLEWLKKQ